MSSRRPSPSPQKRSTALKRADGEPLTRFDIQYDVLYNIFHDTHAVFTDPYSTGPFPKLTFRDLYLSTILHSPKATKALKDKMADSEMFSEDFAMLALLVNVGRVNTTMSFFPEMKTAIRTYHPIPSLQRTSGNLQDAPRIKHILKSTILKDDNGSASSTPADIISRVSIGHTHFADNLDFVELFTRENVSSLSRARAFLWLCYHYLESPMEENDDDYDDDSPTNPFADSRRGNLPTFTFLSDTEIIQENVDPDEEKALAEKLVAQRLEIVKTQGAKELAKQNKGSSATKDAEVDFVAKSPDDASLKGKRPPGKAQTAAAKDKKVLSAVVRDRKLKEANGKDRETISSPNVHETDDEYDFLDSISAAASAAARNQYPQSKYHYQPQLQFESHRHGTPEARVSVRHHPRHRYSPYLLSPKISQASSKHQVRYRQRSSTPPPPRSMLEQAWHIVTTTDPLLDSDEEGADEHLRYDYIRRLRVLNALRRKEPTPEPEHYGSSRAA
ncbi:hypothetical protein C0991_000017 [Blastosporella zonata]|nr:hypothetical protein C0991_000017 [Blastosporella zonata]